MKFTSIKINRGKWSVALASLLALGFTFPSWSSDQNITTVAGISLSAVTTHGFAGDGGPAILAKFNRPFGVWAESNGDLYIADTLNHRIRKVDRLSGVVTTIAGTGVACTPATCGATEGLPALNAQLSSPSQIAIRGGEIFIVEGTGPGTGAARLTKINLSGNLVRVAGTGVAGFTGDGGVATAARIGRAGGGISFGIADQSIYFTDPLNLRLRRINPAGNISTVADFSSVAPAGVVVGMDIDPATGDLYTALPVANTVMVVAAGADQKVEGTVIDPTETTSTVGGLVGLNFPTYIKLVGQALIISDQDNNRVKQVDLNNETLSILAGTGLPSPFLGFSGDGGLATDAMIAAPDGLAHEENGNLFFADRRNGRIRVLAVAPTYFDIDPNAINTKAMGKFATAYLEFPDEADHSPFDVDVSTVTVAPLGASSELLDSPLSAYLSPTAVDDHNNNGIPDRMVKFDRQAVEEWIDFGETAQIRIDGQFNDGRYFTDTATVRFLTPPSQEQFSAEDEETWFD
jgi:hypothetical protein